MKASWLLRFVFAGLVGCTPEQDERSYLVEEPRLLSVLAEPPELRPREQLSLTPVVAGGRAREVDFEFCNAAPAPADPRPVSERCLNETGTPLEHDGISAHGSLPVDACSSFGPDPSGSDQRPHDPDATGGFYVPVVARALGQAWVTTVRVHCSLPDAPADVARALEERYVLNQNPTLGTLEQLAAAGGVEPHLRRGQATELRLSWPAAAREPYVWLSPESELAERREAMSLSWFADSGIFATSATGRSEAESLDSSSNTFTPDPDAASVKLWVVLRDSRGGSAVGSWQLAVE